MNITKEITETIERMVVVIDLPQIIATDPVRAVGVDGVFRMHGEILEVDMADGMGLIHTRRARHATAEEAASDAVVIAKSRRRLV